MLLCKIQYPRVTHRCLGRQLTAQNFDDGSCNQLKSDNISVSRQKESPDPTPGQPGSINKQWRETDVIIPSDLQENSAYTDTGCGSGRQSQASQSCPTAKTSITLPALTSTSLPVSRKEIP